MTKERINDEKIQLGINEQYRHMYGDDLSPKKKSSHNVRK